LPLLFAPIPSDLKAANPEREWSDMPSLKSLIVLPTTDATWVREIELPFPPFPGLGIRVDAYAVLNVRGVVVGDQGYEVTCIVELDDTDPDDVTESMCEALGFAVSMYP
jgi:hypothetical protein